MAIATPQASDNGLRELQEAARDRIIYFRKQFEKEGIDVRADMELKFFVENQHGEQQKNVLHTNRLLNWLAGQGMTRVKRVGYQAIHPGLADTTTDASKYEIDIGEQELTPASHFKAEFIADTAAELKREALQCALHTETCLRNPAFAGHLLRPSFRARPFPDSTDPDLQQATAGMHVNISLYKNGEDIFDDMEVHRHYANALVAMQRDAGIGMLPNENSILRLGANGYVPTQFGFATRTNEKNYEASVLLRNMQQEKPFIENRLSGADADPYVALAVTLAAMWDAYQHPEQQKPVRGPLPREHSNWVESLHNTESRLRKLLGDKLYEQIDRHYATGATRA